MQGVPNGETPQEAVEIGDRDVPSAYESHAHRGRGCALDAQLQGSEHGEDGLEGIKAGSNPFQTALECGDELQISEARTSARSPENVGGGHQG